MTCSSSGRPVPITTLAKRDTLFAEPSSDIAAFRFDNSVAEVFDDMALRSIPLYEELQRSTVDLALRFLRPRTALYDIGCSTGTTLAHLLDAVTDPSIAFFGTDLSEPMLAQARQKLDRRAPKRNWELLHTAVQNTEVINASFVVCHYTLQFSPLSSRHSTLDRIRRGIVPGGALYLSEKLSLPSSENSIVNSLYHSMKRRNGYSEVEIAQKDLALEDVLTPVSEEENKELLRSAGFGVIIPILRGYQFASWLAVAS